MTTTTTYLSDLFPDDLWNEMSAAGYIRIQRHPTAGLCIVNYTEKAQYDRMWNAVTLSCRGLIYIESTHEVIARGFPKFFNWDDAGQPYPPTGPMVLSTKFDGSLGIMYDGAGYPHDIRIATRGSFDSDQAKHATRRFYEIIHDYNVMEDMLGNELYHDVTGLLGFGFTPLFEIIYPENRIVVNYGAADRLVLLDVINNKTGESDLSRFDACAWPDKAEKKLIKGGFSDALTHDIPTGEEGFVLYWPGSGFRCKMKSAEYVELHRTITGLSKKSVWEMLGSGLHETDIAEKVPDELHPWLRETVAELNTKAAKIVVEVQEEYADVILDSTFDTLAGPESRAEFARRVSKSPNRAYLFKLYDHATPEDLWKMAWKTIKPVGDSRAWNRTEDEA